MTDALLTQSLVHQETQQRHHRGLCGAFMTPAARTRQRSISGHRSPVCVMLEQRYVKELTNYLISALAFPKGEDDPTRLVLGNHLFTQKWLRM